MSELRHSREYPVGPDRVFAAMADPTRLARWWGPQGFTNTFVTFEFQSGGAWLFTMHGPDGTDYPNEAKFVEIVAHQRVCIRHVNLPHFELDIRLRVIAEGTLLTWVQTFEDASFAKQHCAFLQTANEQNLDRLGLELAQT